MKLDQCLKDKSYYEDLYDQITVDICREIEKSHKDYKPPVEMTKKNSKQEVMNVMQYALNLKLFLTTGDRYSKKEHIITEWMERDEAKDKLYDLAQAPEGICCFSCNTLMTVTHKDFYDWGSEDKDRVLFMYDCPNKCLPRRAFFDDGEEWKPEPHLCPKCNIELEASSKHTENKIITTEKCTKCDYTNTDELNLTHKKEKVDKNFVKDRVRFCLSEEEGKKYIDSMDNLEQLKQLADKIEEREKNKTLYDKVNKLKKLNIAELKTTLEKTLTKEQYLNLEFSQPEMLKDVIINFTVQDNKTGREEYDSRMTLKKLIQKLLIETNWRLMSDGIDYRLGILSGRLRGYEREEDLLKIIINKKI